MQYAASTFIIRYCSNLLVVLPFYVKTKTNLEVVIEAIVFFHLKFLMV
jgi:hypothetical protein